MIEEGTSAAARGSRFIIVGGAPLRIGSKLEVGLAPRECVIGVHMYAPYSAAPARI